jgi:crotonobetaine/carnitine-CoA ligase
MLSPSTDPDSDAEPHAASSEIQMLSLEPDKWTWVNALREQCERRGSAVFCHFAEGRSHSFQEVETASDAFATGLAQRGIGPGDRVMIVAANSFEFVVAFFGVQKRRAVFVPINTELRGSLLDHQIRDASPKLIIIDREVTAGLPLQELPHCRIISLCDDAPQLGADTVERFADLCVADDPNALLRPEVHDIALILYTSGTTGPSKGVLVPQAHAVLFGVQQARALEMSEDDRFLVALPMFHVNALLMSLGACLLSGAVAYVLARFSASRWLQDIRAARATVTNMLGVMAEFVLQQPPTSSDRTHQLTRVLAVPVSAQWAERFQDRFGVHLVQTYGMTECNMISFSRRDEELISGCVGPVSEDYFEVSIVDPESDRPLDPGAVGEIVVRPRVPFGVMQGYLNRPDVTLRAWRNLWFHTGDAGKIDLRGRLHFVDRMGDVIRRRGENISAFEIEQVLNTHPEVVESAVLGVKVDGAGGEHEVCTYLVLRRPSFDPGPFIDWCVSRLPRYAIPRFLCVVPEIEKTATGKMRKQDLRNRGVTPEMWDRERAGLRLARRA